jgi:membrane protein implicated in regulation of membrane protease activity
MVDWGASVIAFVTLLLFGGVAVYLGYRFVRASAKRAQSGEALAELTERVGQLEDSLASLSTDVQRIAEAEQFTARLLRERNSPVGDR